MVNIKGLIGYERSNQGKFYYIFISIKNIFIVKLIAKVIIIKYEIKNNN